MAEFINIKTDLNEAMTLLKELDGNKDKMRKRVLSGVGTAAKNKVKKAYKSLLNKQSGTLYKSLYSKVVRSGKAVIIAPSAEKNKVRYGYVLAKGGTIKAKNGDFLTFKIGDKWIRKHQVTLPERDWVEKPVKQYLQSADYKNKLDALVQKEITRAEKAAAKKTT